MKPPCHQEGKPLSMYCARTKRIAITADCNQDCIFCDSSARAEELQYSKRNIERSVLEGEGFSRLNISGGEPTLCKHLKRYIRLAKANGYRQVAVLTNGVRLSDGAYVKALKKSGLDQAIVSIYHFDRQVSDSLSNTRGSFSRKIEGIKNLNLYKIEIIANIVIFSGNYKIIPGLTSFLHSEYNIKLFVFSILEPNCSKVRQNPSLIPDLGKAMIELRKAIKYCEERSLRYYIPYDAAVPPCVFRSSGIKVNKPERIEGADYNSPKKHYPICSSCNEKKYCRGLLDEYAAVILSLLGKGKRLRG